MYKNVTELSNRVSLYYNRVSFFLFLCLCVFYYVLTLNFINFLIIIQH